MIGLLKSVLGLANSEIRDKLEEALNFNSDLLSTQEKEMLRFLISDYNVTGQFSNEELFCRKFPEISSSLSRAEAVSEESVTLYLSNLLEKKKRQKAASDLMVMAQRVLDSGVSPDDVELLRSYVVVDEDEEEESLTLEERYRKRKSQPLGLNTFIPEIDSIIGGVSKGLVGVMGGWTGSFKCVAWYERVLTDEGLLTMREIYNTRPKYVLSQEGMKRVSLYHYDGLKKSVILYINGRRVETSPVHRFKVRRNGVVCWVKAENIRVGDMVQSRGFVGVWPEGRKLRDWKKEGSTYGSIVKHAVESESGSRFRAVASSKRFPYALYGACRESVIDFLEGFSKVSGSSDRFVVSHLLFAQELSRVLVNLGCLCKVTTVGYNYEVVPLLWRSLKDTFEALRGEDYEYVVYEQVLGRATSEVEMYDLSVEESPTYMLNGCVTHNTTWALNMFYKNVYENGYNGVYVSLEVPKDDIMYNILSLHSSKSKFSKYPFIGHDRIRKGLLSEEEEDYLWGVVYKDLMENSKGKMVILDETDFKAFSFGEIRLRLEKEDDLMGKQLDMVFWDHANLFKFTNAFRNMSQGEIINQYVSFIRRLSIRWRRAEDGTWRKLANIILAQVNRTGWQKAVKNQGRYSLTALSEANELERCASYVFMVFTNEDMKIAHEASTQLLKSRYGQTIYDPINVFANPEAYVFGEEDDGVNSQINESMFDSMFDVDPTAMGMSPDGLDLSEFDE